MSGILEDNRIDFEKNIYPCIMIPIFYLSQKPQNILEDIWVQNDFLYIITSWKYITQKFPKLNKSIFKTCPFLLMPHVCVRIFMVVLQYLMSLSFKFHWDPSFGCGDISKTIMTFVWRFWVRSRQNVRIQVYASCASVCARIFTKLFFLAFIIL